MRHRTFGRHEPAAGHVDGGEGSLRITGWDVDPHEKLRLGIGTPGRPVASRSPRIRMSLRCPVDAGDACYPVDPAGPLSSVRGEHAETDAAVLAVPERPGETTRSSGRTDENRGRSARDDRAKDRASTCMLEPGESIVRTYELVAAPEFDGRLPTGAYRFESDLQADTDGPGFTLWLTR